MNIRKMDKSEMDKARLTLSLAFNEDPLYRHFVSSDKRRADYLRRFMQFRLRFGIKNGEVYATDSMEAIAVWLPSNAKVEPKDAILYGGLSAMLLAGKDTQKNVMAFTAFIDELGSKFAPEHYWTLAPIAVRPESQCLGYGSALMKHGLSLLDAKNAPCVLDTQSEKNRCFYEKFGFKTLDSTLIPNTDIINHFMVRD